MVTSIGQNALVRMGGHLYIINGDVTSIACDAWLLSTDTDLLITPSFSHAPNDGQWQEIRQLQKRNKIKSVWTESGSQVSCIKIQSKDDPSSPTLWLGDIGRTEDEDLDHFAKQAREFVRVAAADVRNSSLNPDLERRPLLALNVVGSGHGGKREERGPLLKTLIKSLVESAEETRADVVLVTWGSVMYSAAQKVRREVAESKADVWKALPDELRTEGERLAKVAASGELVIFAGAGVSRDAGVPLWGDLLEQVARKLEMTDSEIGDLKQLDQRDQATVIEKRGGEQSRALVNELVSRNRYALLHGLISSLPVREFVTTNFDQLLEMSARTAGRRLKIITQEPIRSGDRWLLKLHGDLGKDLVLARADYMSALQLHTPLRGLVQSLLLQKHMLFIGYSLSDEDFHHLMHDLRATLSRNEPGSIGTVLTLHRSGFGNTIWPELQFVPSEVDSDGTSEVMDEELVRRLTVLMDYVGCLAASDTRFVLDESMGDVRSTEDQELAELLTRMDDLLQQHPSESGKWSEVRAFLERFGQNE